MAKGYESGYFWLMLSKKVKIVIFKLVSILQSFFTLRFNNLMKTHGEARSMYLIHLILV